MTVVTVDTYAGISHVLPDFWPYYEKSGCDLIGIERTNKATTWPKEVPHYAIGEDYFTSWANKQNDPFLCNRVLDTIELFLKNPDLAKYDDICLIEWDMIFTRPLPPLDAETGLVLNLAGFAFAGFKAKQFFHLPWWMDRKRAELIVNKGRELVAAGDIEHGSNDFFLGLVVDRLGIPWKPIHFYTRNRIDSYQFEEARLHVAQGAYGVHGVRDKAGIDRIVGAN